MNRTIDTRSSVILKLLGFFFSKITLILFILILISSPGHAGQYEDGIEAYGRKDYPQAMKLWRDLANQGNADAQLAVGTMYFYGMGIKQDYLEAKNWLLKAAEQGSARGQLGIGTLYYMGHGVEQNYSEAMKWCRMAAEHGVAEAQVFVAQLFFHGLGTKQDWPIALEWFHKAAEQGDRFAQLYLGYLHQNGIGVTQSDTESYFWYSLGLRASAIKMTPEEKATLDKRLSEWKPNPSPATIEWERKGILFLPATKQ